MAGIEEFTVVRHGQDSVAFPATVFVALLPYIFCVGQHSYG